ncbi:beta-ketoacyl-[acyl-carrier-protein] synthase family protein [Pseudocolwellia agarivorans]|uniref:beta-ketoacyl-[acyl-carrier-protein] synthase family protein n=1 Tax=Pseudocolwellia agarivorans TaxID=1911682 RepID=UPI00158DC0DE|nr:beta-ketoacyl-[acyl-carrier-protein] synthase family protein [Pseudocolwellia agarivorans]
MSKRIVVTGMGAISAAGNNVSHFSEYLFDNNNKLINTIAPISLFTPEPHHASMAAEVKNYDPAKNFSKAELKHFDRFTQFALLATDEAITQSKLAFNDRPLAQRTCVVHGTSIGGQETIEQSYSLLFESDKKRAHPFTVPKLLPSSATSHISMKYGIKGPAFTTSSACSSSGHALIMSVLMLRSNMVDVAITGGAEACITSGNFHAWDGLRVLSHDTCRPFSANRSGLIIGEGAATLVLETLDHALARGADIYGEIVGVGMSSDAHNMIQPLAEGAEMAMNAALQDADILPSDIAYINAHGSGTKQNDKTETYAIHQVFKAHAPQLKVSSTKAIHGHVLGAGAALESIASILAIEKQQCPPTKNFKENDDECNLDYVPNQAQPHGIEYAMSNSFAFGGLNTCIIFKKYIPKI